ncbi:vWA domain-containing protein [Actibacterium sp. XHP0104]|uniref:vWA domain-containing protein n=1 Tax=Actibacterium sp. XHP0104 TaxID=2984335 RepID=UPI0021E713D0|nr:VWA domain-containing protein [Actibacterium sp. XHP0104]MCV2882316.1 VWA domain-containing protein [Actibacterium sp. XHP0104]
MTDDLDLLKQALKATPPADEATKAAHLRAAMESFDQLQETRDAARQTDRRPTTGARLSQGVARMFHSLTTRAGLAATTGIATIAAAFILFTPEGQQMTAPPQVLLPEKRIAPPPVTVLNDVAEADMAQDTAAGAAAPAPEPMIMQEAAEAETFAAAPQALSRKAAPVGGLYAAHDARHLIAPAPTETEAYPGFDPNPVKLVAKDPVSTFSIDVDTAAYSVVRSSLMRGQLPPADSVRAEEMINYFPYAYPAPTNDAPFATHVTVAPAPWNAGKQLVHIGIQGKLPALDARPPLNLVFLIDTSGSMQSADKLPLLKQSFRLMLGQLRPEDEVAIVTYAGSAGQVLAPTRAEDRATILAALDRLEAGGSTAGQAGLQQAYAIASAMAEEGQVSRVILATDGDFNVGLSDPEALKSYIADQRAGGAYLSVLGFGRGNLDDATMQALAQNGNGQAAYIDTLNEAQKVLVDQLSGALFPIADDVKIQVEFNPATVAEYRLIGYETRALRREDFNNDKVDAGEIGAGHSVTAIYEITPVGSEAVLNDPLRYGRVTAPDGPADELGFLRLRYKAPGAASSQLIEAPIPVGSQDAGPEARFAFAIAGFAQLLTDSPYLGDWGWEDAIALANGARGEDAFGYRAEAVNLMRLGQSLRRP